MAKQFLASLTTLLAAAAGAQTDGSKSASIHDFLADTSGGYVGAAGIIGMDSKLVRDVSTPKEFVASVNAARNDDSKDGIGIAFAPGRSRFEKAAIDISKVEFNDRNGRVMSPARRLWGSTTFSYAQNKTTIDGVDYRQRAYAVNVEYYFDINDDPTFAAHRKFMGNGGTDACAKARTATGSDASRLASAQQQARGKATTSRVAAARALADSEVAGADAGLAARAKAAQKEADADDALDTAIADCAKAATAAAKDKWNTPKATLLWGRGQIKGPAAGDARLSLGTHLQFNLAASPEYVANGFKDDETDTLKKSLVTVSYSRATNVLDTTTIATTPAYKTRSLFAARYTREMGGDRSSYLLGEVSTARSRDGGTDAGTYKYAVGLDYKLGANMWLELRSGRSIARGGNGEETKTLMSLKFAPEPGLASLFTAP